MAEKEIVKNVRNILCTHNGKTFIIIFSNFNFSCLPVHADWHYQLGNINDKCIYWHIQSPPKLEVILQMKHTRTLDLLNTVSHLTNPITIIYKWNSKIVYIINLEFMLKCVVGQHDNSHHNCKVGTMNSTPHTIYSNWCSVCKHLSKAEIQKIAGVCSNSINYVLWLASWCQPRQFILQLSYAPFILYANIYSTYFITALTQQSRSVTQLYLNVHIS